MSYTEHGMVGRKEPTTSTTAQSHLIDFKTNKQTTLRKPRDITFAFPHSSNRHNTPPSSQPSPLLMQNEAQPSRCLKFPTSTPTLTPTTYSSVSTNPLTHLTTLTHHPSHSLTHRTTHPPHLTPPPTQQTINPPHLFTKQTN